VRRFGKIENILKNADECRWPALRVELKRNGKKALLYRKLTTLRRDVPLTVSFDDLRSRPAMVSHIKDMLKLLEASSRLQELFSIDLQTARIVPHVEDPFEWWQEELRCPGQRLPDEPQCGFYQRQLILRGPMVPARIWRTPEIDVEGNPTGMDILRCRVGTRECDPNAEWTRLSMNPIKESDYHYEEADAAHARQYRRTDPKANPTKQPDLMKATAPRAPKQKRR
ncbi:MAG: hypothetical protein KGL35_10380, partial [Bradyrhizobium sp.]|nr:hypothetical protein [Bradyrhizobium sp.]